MVLVTIVIPVYRDSEALARTLSMLDSGGAEVIVVSTGEDAGSLAPLRLTRSDIVWIQAPRGRARQMNAGAAVAHGRWLLFLHADTRLSPDWRSAIVDADREPRLPRARGVSAGCFRFALDSRSPIARLIELGVRLRVRLFALPYGDQALFVKRDVFEALHGYSDLPIMEDVDLVRRLRARPSAGPLFRAPYPAITSARRWERDGWVGRTARHLALVVLYFCGVAPARLIRLDRGR
jgi:rSAM/selenodomain-associated transferase 2